MQNYVFFFILPKEIAIFISFCPINAENPIQLFATQEL